MLSSRDCALVPAITAAFLGLAPIFVSPVAAQDATGTPAILRSTRTVSLPSGAVIRRTDRPVANQRVVQIPGTPSVIVLWEEVGAGGSTPYYAISLDGRTLAGRVYETSNMVRLRYAEFDPLRAEPVAPQGLLASGGSQVALVQCVCTPLPVMQEQIQGAGATILRHLPENSMIVRMAPGAEARVRALPYVRWTGKNHIAYKLDESIRADLVAGRLSDTRERYSIECFERGAAAQQRVANVVTALGGIVEVMTPDQFRMEASLSVAQLLQIADLDDVSFIDPWGGPGGLDMDIVRQIGGANFIETTLGETGQGVRAEVFDSELRNTHQEFTLITPLSHSGGFGVPTEPHGTSTYGIVFARGATAQARGMLPNAEEGYYFDYHTSTQFGGLTTRLSANQQLVDPAQAFKCVFQTSSIGSAQVTSYTTISAEVDDYLFRTDLLSTQSQSNTGNNNSRPQAWAKNIVSVGAITHYDTLTRTDDTYSVTPVGGSCGVPFGAGASVGPASDLRVKPDLCFFFDCTFTSDNASNTAYTQFSGTSGATPSVGGHFGLFFQMWHNGVWAGHGGGSTVFADRAHMMTAKAALINSAFRYTWTAGGPNASINRNVQGWGMPDLQNLYTLRNKTFIVDETDVLAPLGSRTYNIQVAPAEPSLNVTLCYKDPQGTVGAAQQRINDLTLKVTAPNGTIYWGDNGLTADNFSTSGGAANTRDTVENVFVQNPIAGVWQVTVWGDQIVQDAHTQTPAIDADYGLWLTGGVQAVVATAPGPFAYSVQSNGDQHLYRIDLGSGAATDLGAVTFHDAEGISFGPNGDLFAIGGTTPEFWNISLAPGTLVGNTGTRNGTDAGLDYFDGVMYNLNGNIGASSLYRINTSTGAATLVGSSAIYADSLAIDTLGNGYAVGGLSGSNNLYSVNLSTGAMALVGPLGTNFNAQTGLSFSPDNKLYLINSSGQYYTVNTSTGAATLVGNVTVNGVPTGSWEGLGIDKTSAVNIAPLPPFSSTFSAAALTRGFYFTAPINGEITGLRVPDESAAGVQNVEVVRLSAAPPAFPTTTNSFVSLGRFANVTGNNVIACDIPVSAGDIIGVLGACGTATMQNSYSTSAPSFPSTMKGQSIAMARLGMQHNLNTAPASDLFTENPGPISRVEVYYLDGRNNLYLTGDTAPAGSNLATTPLASPVGTTTWSNGELFVNSGGDPEFVAAGAQGNCFDGLGSPANCEFNFNYDVDSVSFIYGGNLGSITVEARNASGALVDSFFQADTNTAPAGPQSVAGSGIRKLRWFDTAGQFSAIDNVRIHATNSCWVNCDNSTTIPILNVNDFVCFQGRFAAGDPLANCDGSTTVPVLNVNDFVCFQARFAAGCPAQ